MFLDQLSISPDVTPMDLSMTGSENCQVMLESSQVDLEMSQMPGECLYSRCFY